MRCRTSRSVVVEARSHSSLASMALSLLSPGRLSCAGAREEPQNRHKNVYDLGSKALCLNQPELHWEPFDPDDFSVLGKFGKGSYGTVWRARCKAIAPDAEVAIKVLKKDRPKNPRSLVLRKIQREADILEEMQAAVSIPVKLLGRFEDDAHAYFVTEAVCGDTLQRVVQKGAETREKRLNESQLIRLCSDMLRFLSSCHERRVVYGDVKPANLLLSGVDGSVRVVDFGCSQRLPDDYEYLRCRCGTPAYWAPEIFHKRYDTKADVWGLGIVLYQLVTGRYPWFDNLKNVRPRDVLYSIENQQIPFVQSEWSHVSPSFRDAVFHMLAKDPSDRLSAQQALALPFLTGVESTMLPL